MQHLERRVQKLEEKHLGTDEEMIITVSSLCSPEHDDLAEDKLRQFPPLDEQIAAGRTAGKKVIVVYDI